MAEHDEGEGQVVSPGEVDIEERSPVASPAAVAADDVRPTSDAPNAADEQPQPQQQQQAQEEQQEEPVPTPSPQTPVRPAGAPSVRAMPQSAPPTPAPAQAAAAQAQHQRQHSGQQQPQAAQQITPPRSATQPSSLQGTPLKPPSFTTSSTYQPAVTLSAPIGSGSAAASVGGGGAGESGFWDSMFSSGTLTKCSPDLLEWCPDLGLAPPQTTLGNVADWVRLQQSLADSDRATGHVPPYPLRFGYVDELGEYHPQLEWATSADGGTAAGAAGGGGGSGAAGRSKRESKHTPRAREAAKDILSSIQHHRVPANRAVALPPTLMQQPRKNSATAAAAATAAGGAGLPPLAPGTAHAQQQQQSPSISSSSSSGAPSASQLNPQQSPPANAATRNDAQDSQWLLNSEDGI